MVYIDHLSCIDGYTDKYINKNTENKNNEQLNWQSGLVKTLIWVQPERLKFFLCVSS